MKLYKITYNRSFTRTVSARNQHEALERLIKQLDSVNGEKLDLYSEYRGLIINQCKKIWG